MLATIYHFKGARMNLVNAGGGVIVPPPGKVIKQIMLSIDDKGSVQLVALDLRVAPPVPMQGLETLFWLTRVTSEILARSSEHQLKAVTMGASDGAKTD